MTEAIDNIVRRIECSWGLRLLVASVFGILIGVTATVYIINPVMRAFVEGEPPVRVVSVIAPNAAAGPGDSVRVAFTVLQSRLCKNRMMRQWYGMDGSDLGRASVVRTAYTAAGEQIVPMILTVPLDAAGQAEAVHHAVVVSECADGVHASPVPDVRVKIKPPPPLDPRPE